jgi:hypothetical protein
LNAGRFWGAFSVIDLFLLNALTITEFIGIALALDYLGLPRQWGVAAGADHRCLGGHRQLPPLRTHRHVPRRAYCWCRW